MFQNIDVYYLQVTGGPIARMYTVLANVVCYHTHQKLQFFFEFVFSSTTVRRHIGREILRTIQPLLRETPNFISPELWSHQQPEPEPHK